MLPLEHRSISEQIMDKYEEFIAYIHGHTGEVLWSIFICILIFVLARITLAILSRFTKYIMNSSRYHKSPYQGKRVDTVMTLVRSAGRYSIYAIAIIVMLKQLNLSGALNSLIVTAGIGSLALGFGAQNLVRDVVTGMFMMFENQFSVGDFVCLDGSEGFVEATAVRVTYLRSVKGEQIIIPNGTINKVINYTRGANLASIVISTPYEENTANVMQIIQSAVDDYYDKNKDIILEKPNVKGITEFSASSVDIGVSCKVVSMQNRAVERGMRLAIKEVFDEKNISFPYTTVVTTQMNSEKAVQNNENPSKAPKPKNKDKEKTK